MIARRSDWKTLPLPKKRATLHVDRAFSLDEFELVKAGIVPEDMDDKWFAYFEAPWLYAHRSWTGVCVFHVRFGPDRSGVRVVETLVNRKSSQYGGRDSAADVLMVTALLDGMAGRENRSTWEKYFDRITSKGDPA